MATMILFIRIAQRAFQQQFTLSDDVVVKGAELINGLLTLYLEKIIPDERKPKKIEIKSPKRILGKNKYEKMGRKASFFNPK